MNVTHRCGLYWDARRRANLVYRARREARGGYSPEWLELIAAADRADDYSRSTRATAESKTSDQYRE